MTRRFLRASHLAAGALALLMSPAFAVEYSDLRATVDQAAAKMAEANYCLGVEFQDPARNKKRDDNYFSAVNAFGDAMTEIKKQFPIALKPNDERQTAAGREAELWTQISDSYYVRDRELRTDQATAEKVCQAIVQ